VHDILVAYLESMMLAEPLQSELWQSAGLTLVQLGVLRALRPGPVQVSRLVAQLALSPASLTRILNRLEARRLLARLREGADRRQVTVILQPEGSRLLGEIAVLEDTYVQRAVEGMPAAEQTDLLRGLRNLVERSRVESTGVTARRRLPSSKSRAS
jgi:DNA-binding MarR family transcriptional regulator